MKRATWRWLSILMITAVVGLLLYVPAGAAGEPVLSIENLDISQFPQMTLTLQVLDSRGSTIQNLTPDSFELSESTLEEQVPISIQTLQVRTDRIGMGISLILDMRGNTSVEELVHAREVANTLLESFNLVGDPGGDVAELWVVGVDPPLQVGFTSDGGSLTNKINQVLPPALDSGSLNDVVRRTLSKADSGKKRQVAIVISTTRQEGEMLDSLTTQLALDNQIPIFTVDLASAEETLLTDLAITTGGDHYTDPSPEILSNIRDRIATQLKLEYVLGFRSKLSQDGREHTLRVVVRIPQGNIEKSETFRIPSDAIAVRRVSLGLLISSVSIAILGLLFTYLAGRQFGYHIRARK